MTTAEYETEIFGSGSTRRPSRLSPELEEGAVSKPKIIEQVIGYSPNRKFVSQWLHDFDWLEFDQEKGVMFCKVCSAFQLPAERPGFAISPFVKGSCNFRRTNVMRHGSSKHHTQCCEERAFAIKEGRLESSSPATVYQPIRIDKKQYERVKKLVNTAYFVAKSELPFEKYTSLLELQRINGIDLGSKYLAAQDCERLVGLLHIFLILNKFYQSIVSYLRNLLNI